MITLSAVTMSVFEAVLTQAHLSVQEVARQLHLKAHTVRRTIDLLRKSKVLLGVRPYVNPSLLGISEYYIYFKVHDGNPSVRDAFVKAVCRNEQVAYLGELGGDFRYEVRFMAPHAYSLVEFTDLIAEQFRTKVSIASLCLIHDDEYSPTASGG